MILYIDAVSPHKFLYIDYLYLKCKDGREIGIDWDETDWAYENGAYSSRHKGVYFNDEYANGRVKEIEGAELGDVFFEWSGSESEPDNSTNGFNITSIIFEDYDDEKNETVQYKLI